VLKLFARLKELSAKLLPSKAKKPRDRLLTGSSEPKPPSLSLKTSEKDPHVKARFIDTGNLNSPSAPGKIVPKQAVAPSTVASPLRRLGSIVASPFRGPKPLYKRKRFWLGSGLGLGGLALGGAWLFVDNSVSQYKAADALNYVRPGSVTIKGLNGAVLLQTGEATRETLKLWQMPTNLKNAFVAIEDRRFYEHDGVDYKGVTRAMVTNLTSKNIAEGASSINQQLARVVYLDQEKSFWRKLREVRIAQKLGKELTKDQVLERYLNLVYLGEHTYGVADAAMVYFSKTVDKLSLAEMATLAAMPPAPNRYSPFVNPDFARKRRNLVLDRMVDAKFITKAEAETAKAEVLKPKRSQLPSAEQQARYFTKYIEQELPQRISKKQIKAGGLIIETTLNPEWQKKAEEVINTTVRQNRGSFGQAAMVSVDPRTGGIRSMVGGTDFAKNQFNRVTQAKRQPGSTFKPFVYSTAIAGGISPNKTYLDAPVEIGLDEGGHYNPKNAGKNFKGSISMRDALVNSVNIVAIKVLIDAGYQPVIDLAHKMGVQSELKPVYALALGAVEVNLLEMTSAYTTFANKGIHNPVHGITRVTNKKGEILYENKPKPEKVLEPDTTAIMTWMMRGVVNEGTARSAQIGRPVAGKTGTTDKERDLWFIGFIPQLVTGVWLGNDNNQPTGNASSTAAYAWSRFMTTAVKNIPAQDFLPRPDDVDRRKPEIKLDPVHPRYQKTLAVPAKDDKNGEESTSQDGSRRSRRSRRSESANNSTSDSPRRSRRSESAENSTSDSPRRSRRSRRAESADNNNSNSESTSRRSRRRSRRSEGNSESTPSSSDE
jgi:penicillin-binding protein 1A